MMQLQKSARKQEGKMPKVVAMPAALLSVFLLLLFPYCTAVVAQQGPTWTDGTGRVRNNEELTRIMSLQHQWISSLGKKGTRATLKGAKLSGVDLHGEQLNSADLSGADLTDANLTGTVLLGADLTGAKLFRAKLGGSDLRLAKMSHTRMNGADLTLAQLQHANLIGSDLTDTNMTKVDGSGADFTGSGLSNANLTEARLIGANLTNASAAYSILERADLSQTFLQHASLFGVRAAGANFYAANLDSTMLNKADLTGARFSFSDFRTMYLRETNFRATVFQPALLPETNGTASALSLELMTYEDSPTALVQLRKQFFDAGFREQERKITYALKRREAELSKQRCSSRKLASEERARAIIWASDSIVAYCGSFALNELFDWTCQYGMSPGRPLVLCFLLWFCCSLLYFAFVHTSGPSGLYRSYYENPELEADPSGHKTVKVIRPWEISSGTLWKRLRELIVREISLLGTSMFFSLMSAFNIGFRDVNFGRWLRLLTRKEFDIKSAGWARVVAGWQSLISVVFVALFILTFFGRPFG
jgi:uncharacterized protein YjbI with pentapeptide repeats